MFYITIRITDSYKRYSITFSPIKSTNPAHQTGHTTFNTYNHVGVKYQIRNFKIEKGNVATPWAPAPEDLETTIFKPLFDNKIKSALYWNRALTDEELLQVYNTQIKRI